MEEDFYNRNYNNPYHINKTTILDYLKKNKNYYYRNDRNMLLNNDKNFFIKNKSLNNLNFNKKLFIDNSLNLTLLKKLNNSSNIKIDNIMKNYKINDYSNKNKYINNIYRNSNDLNNLNKRYSTVYFPNINNNIIHKENNKNNNINDKLNFSTNFNNKNNLLNYLILKNNIYYNEYQKDFNNNIMKKIKEFENLNELIKKTQIKISNSYLDKNFILNNKDIINLSYKKSNSEVNLIKNNYKLYNIYKKNNNILINNNIKKILLKKNPLLINQNKKLENEKQNKYDYKYINISDNHNKHYKNIINYNNNQNINDIINDILEDEKYFKLIKKKFQKNKIKK